MITGHFGLAAGVKKLAPQLPLWTLLLGTFWLDVIFMLVSAFGLESFTPMDPANPAYGEVIIHAPYTHSLLGAILISALTGWLASLRWKKQSGVILGAVIFSHWILDVLVHRPDLPILPGNLGSLPLLGLGLWDYPMLSGTLELALATGGIFFYFRSTVERRLNRSRALTASLSAGILLLTLFVVNALGF